MRTSFLFTMAALAAGSPVCGFAAGDHVEAAAQVQATQGKAQMAEALVKKVDKPAGKVTLAHGPLANLGMPAMTMVFRVKDPAWLDRMKEGDKIRFTADRVNGAMTVMSFEAAK